jgi:hypothetical protein
VVPLPPDKVTGAPKLTPLVWNWTVPLGVPEAGATGLTLAVKETVWPATEGFAEEMIVVLVFPITATVAALLDALPCETVTPRFTGPESPEDQVIWAVPWPAVMVPLVILQA